MKVIVVDTYEEGAKKEAVSFFTQGVKVEDSKLNRGQRRSACAKI